MQRKALIVVTSNSNLGNTNQKTGWFLSEVSHVYWPLHKAGFEITFASPVGGDAPMEESSLKIDDAENKLFVDKYNISNSLKTISVKEVNPQEFSIIYFAGGHGTMWDFPGNVDINKVTSEIYENGGIVAAVCHGPSALTDVKLSDGSYLVEGKRINSFTNAEEKEVEKDDIVPFLLETRLKERGAIFVEGEKWENKVVVDGRIITGQNPQSAASLGEAIVRVANQIELSQSGKSDEDDSLHWVVQT
ncbi:MAG TPA: type 1 glutamine amidotransferase domain-containing protein [Bacteriovoracaceae bacterium]|nr:type 1 glutamine amidotransferase domain-containing protein [Bacteriovoracaceae bacterium]